MGGQTVARGMPPAVDTGQKGTGGMTLDEFRQTLTADRAPTMTPALRALWHDAKGDWYSAHHVAQDDDGIESAWVHAYLHRKEGDLSNASYWYRRAERPVASDSLEAESDRIAGELLTR